MTCLEELSDFTVVLVSGRRVLEKRSKHDCDIVLGLVIIALLVSTDKRTNDHVLPETTLRLVLHRN